MPNLTTSSSSSAPPVAGVRPREDGYSGSDEEEDDGGYIPKNSRVASSLGSARPTASTSLRQGGGVGAASATLASMKAAMKADAAIKAIVDQQRGEVKSLDYASAAGAYKMVDLDELRAQEQEMPDDTDYEGDQAARDAALQKRKAERAALLATRDVRFIWER